MNRKIFKMLKIYELNKITTEEKNRILNRSEAEIENLIEKVNPIIEDIRKRGDEAIIEYCEKFDNVKFTNPKEFKVSEEEIKEAYEKIDESSLKAIKKAKRNIEKFHKLQLEQIKDFKVEIEKGVFAGRIIVPLQIAGLYVPGGKAIYPSVMLMLSTPARVANVNKIVACVSTKTKKLDPSIIVAGDINKVEIYKIGGVQAIAAMAYGTKTIPKVDIIVGPGNPYVSAAQRLVSIKSKVKIPFPPGPSEGMIIADEYSNPKFCAADLLSEAEHGSDSAGILVTHSKELAENVKKLAIEMIEKLPEPRKKYILENLKKYSGIILTKNLKESIEFVNEYAPEHLIIATRNAKKVMKKIKNAGTICLGNYTPITAGNFLVGTNAILPTGKYGKFFSGISVETFLKTPTYEFLTKKGLKKLKNDLDLFCDLEGFPAHRNSVDIRFK